MTGSATETYCPPGLRRLRPLAADHLKSYAREHVLATAAFLSLGIQSSTWLSAWDPQNRGPQSGHASCLLITRLSECGITEAFALAWNRPFNADTVSHFRKARSLLRAMRTKMG